MNKEIKAKIEEFVKEYGRRELSMEEADQVAGGGIKFQNFEINTEEDLDYFVYTIIAAYEELWGKDITADILKNWFPSYTLLEDYQHAGLDGLHNHLGIALFDRPGGFH